MAASYAASHADELDGRILLAAYPTENLTSSGLAVCSIYGSEDGVMNKEKYDVNRADLPDDVAEFINDGACYVGFGSYGPQDGDGTPAISGEEQIARATERIADIVLTAVQ